MKFADLKALRSTPDNIRCWVDEAVVFSTVHLPPAELAILSAQGDKHALVSFACEDTGEFYLRCHDFFGGYMKTMAAEGMPELANLLRRCQMKGFTHIRISPIGYEFPDLPRHED